MKPYYDHAGITIYHGDCRDILPQIPAGSVDLVLTDPPYGVGFAGYESHDDSPSGYADFMWPAIEAAERTLRQTGLCCVFQSAKYARRWAEWFPRDWRPIAIPKAFVQMRTSLITWATDYALLWELTDAPKGRQGWQPVARDWFYSSDTAIPRGWPERGHPCPRPPDMMRYLVSILAPPDSLILDPFMGSGTTLVAAKQLGRRAIGIEIEEKYCEIAVKRLAQEVLPMETHAPEPEQARLIEASDAHLVHPENGRGRGQEEGSAH